mgnify:FL=1|jgi:hypothetical protein
MKQNIQFFSFINGDLQFKWIEPIEVEDGQVNKFGRKHQVVDGKVEFRCHEGYPTEQTAASYYYNKEMEDKGQLRVGGLNSRDYMEISYLYQKGGSWYKEYVNPYTK